MGAQFVGLGVNSGPPKMPTSPSGWPVGSFATYSEACRAVNYLAHSDVPLTDVTIVGVKVMLVERVLDRTGRAGLVRLRRSGWMALLAEPLRGPIVFWLCCICAGLLTATHHISTAQTVAAAAGAVGGAGAAALSYLWVKPRHRRWRSASHLVANRYDVLTPPNHAAWGRHVLSRQARRQPSRRDVRRPRRGHQRGSDERGSSATTHRDGDARECRGVARHTADDVGMNARTGTGPEWAGKFESWRWGSPTNPRLVPLTVPTHTHSVLRRERQMLVFKPPTPPTPHQTRGAAARRTPPERLPYGVYPVVADMTPRSRPAPPKPPTGHPPPACGDTCAAARRTGA